MPQTLYIKQVINGREIRKSVTVQRVFLVDGGPALFLHKNGVYGYKDGSPVRTETELDQIGNLTQRNLAKRWWRDTGQKLSEEYYARLAAEEAKALEAEIADPSALAAEGDYLLYRRREVDKKDSQWSVPFTWMELGFDRRPDWWGVAPFIRLNNGYEYELVEDAGNEDHAEPGPDNKRAGKKKSVSEKESTIKAAEL